MSDQHALRRVLARPVNALCRPCRSVPSTLRPAAAVHDSSARFFLCAADADLTWAAGSSRSRVLASEGIAAPRRSYVVGLDNSQIASAGALDADAMSCYGRPGGPWFASGCGVHELQVSPRNPPASPPRPLLTPRAQSVGSQPAAASGACEEEAAAERCGGPRRKDSITNPTPGSTPTTRGLSAPGVPMEPLRARPVASVHASPPSRKPRLTTATRGGGADTSTTRAPSGSAHAPLGRAWGALEYRQRCEHAADVQAVMDLPPL